MTLLSTYFTLEGKTAFKHPVSCVLVSKEQSRRNKEESGHAVQEEEKQPKPDAEKCSLTGDSNKPTRGNSLVSAKGRLVFLPLTEQFWDWCPAEHTLGNVIQYS